LADILKDVAEATWNALGAAIGPIWDGLSKLFSLESAANAWRRPKGKMAAPPPPHTVRLKGKLSIAGDDVPFSLADFTTWSQKYETWLLDIAGKMPNPGAYFDERFDPLIAELAQGAPIRFILFGAFSFLRYLMGLFDAIADVGVQAARMRANVFSQQALPDVSTLALIGIRYPTADLATKGLAKYYGYSDGAYELLQESMRNVPDTATIRDLYYRIMPASGMSEEDVTDETLRYLRFQGLAKPDAERVIQSWAWYPSPLDIVRFVVREVFDPETQANFYRLHPPPKEYLDAVAKAGMPAEQAKWYWDAHWELPSLTMGYDMLHRGIIDRQQLYDLMVAQDVMPGWRERLMDVSYHPYTRVDVRRMYDLKVLGPADLVKAYKDGGYDQEHAEKLAQWTMLASVGKERSAARSTLDRLYLRDLLPPAEYEDGLRALRFGEDAIALIRLDMDTRKDETRMENLRETVHSNYLVGAITPETARANLIIFGTTAIEAERYLATWRAERVRLAPKVPLADLKEWLRNGLLKQGEFRTQMERAGYELADIKLYVQAAGLTPSAEVFG
jgi:hypothetical protein